MAWSRVVGIRRLARTGIPVFVACAALVASGAGPAPAQTATSPANDAFSHPVVLVGVSGDVAQAAVGATRETGEPRIGLLDSGRFSFPGSVWFSWTAAVTGTVDFSVSGAVGAVGAVHVSVFDGETIGSLRELGAADSAGSTQAAVGALEVVAGTTYRVVVASEAPNIVLRWASGPVATTPGNDETPALLPPVVAAAGGFDEGTISGANTGATRAAGEPDHGTVGGTHSVWYRYVAPEDQLIQFQTFGSRFDTALGVYTAARVRLAANDDAIPDVARYSATSWVRLRAGQLILVAVDGRAGAHGMFTLRYTVRVPGPPNDFFADATVINGSGSASFSPLDATFEDGETPTNSPGSLWYRYQSPLSGTVRLSFGAEIDGTYEGRVALGSVLSELQGFATFRGSRSSTGQYPTANVSTGPIRVRAGEPMQIAVGGVAFSDSAPEPVLRWSFAPDAPPPPVVQRTTAVEPVRVVDTRVAGQRFGPDETRRVPLAGRGGIPASGVTAAIVNVTATESEGRGYVTVRPSDSPGPASTSNLNTAANETRANLVVVGLGSDGAIDLTSSVATHMVIDVLGWVGVSGDGGYVPFAPHRALDTRTRPAGRAKADEVIEVTAPLLPGGVTPTAVAVNITATGADSPVYVTAFPGGQVPDTSNLNVRAGQTLANLTIVRVGSDGRFRLRASAATHLIADIEGVFARSGTGSFVSMAPTRLRDDRQFAALPTTEPQLQQIRGLAGVPDNATAVVLNVTAVEHVVPGVGVLPTAEGFVQLAPSENMAGSTSNLNFRPGADVANLAIVQIGADGRIRIATSTPVPLILDIVGWYD